MEAIFAKPQPDPEGAGRRVTSVVSEASAPGRTAVPGKTVPASVAKPGGELPRSDTPAATDEDRILAELLADADIYRQFEKSFTETTGLPVSFRPVEIWQLPLHGKHHENPLCAFMAEKSRSCAVCLQTLQRLSEEAVTEPSTMSCPIGLCETAVPVRLGERLIGFLETGQVFRKAPTPGQLERVGRLIAEWGVPISPDELRAMYLNTRVVAPKYYEAAVNLLVIFAQHLSMVSNQIVVKRSHAEPPVISKAKHFIGEHQAEDLSLAMVARAVNTSTFYFCKMFKKATGLNFTEYVSRVRIEKAKNLLLNPNLRISEIAFEVGFQSLTHFNRVFKKITGHSPSEYRSLLPGG